MDRIQPIIEVSPVIQGEGSLMGVPSILIRTTGCPFACDFSGSKCDTPYASVSPEAGKYSLKDVDEIVSGHPNINHIVVSGGEPTIHRELMEAFVAMYAGKHHLTIETAGYNNVEGFDLISLSPKLSNSIPAVENRAKHMKAMNRTTVMRSLIADNKDFQVKYVISDDKSLYDAMAHIHLLNVSNDKVWLMPAGSNRAELSRHRAKLMNLCVSYGYNYSDRLHIVGFNDKRYK